MKRTPEPTAVAGKCGPPVRLSFGSPRERDTMSRLAGTTSCRQFSGKVGFVSQC
jgi:hypothetical protein